MKKYVCIRTRTVHQPGIKLFYVEWGGVSPYSDAEKELFKRIKEEPHTKTIGKTFVVTHDQLKQMGA